ncbi:ferric reductase-like transmembrane domain-containing protein [Candidatus Curtissbacteria bacterium]|nr:ferric reductase-like transmembrane domain-containing protein [Candidatus Curtissbacteria bacterium]
MFLDLQRKIYLKIAKKEKFIRFLSNLVYLAIVGFWPVAYLSTVGILPGSSYLYSLGVKFGQGAITLLGIVVIPGILGRFGIEIPITRTITLFRRRLGILVFLLGLTHYLLVRLLSIILGYIKFQIFPPLFELLGMSTLSLLFLLFLTSNNKSVRSLGKWWKRLHRLIYLVLWLLVFHTGLQRISKWTLFIGLFALLEIISFIYLKMKTRDSLAGGALPTQSTDNKK